MNPKKIRILLADDHSLVRIGLTTLLNTQSDLAVVGEAEDGDEAVALYDRLTPDVVIMDLMMAGTDGAEATRRIRERHPDARVIILTSFTTSDELARALSYGAVGAQRKGSSTDGLLVAIRAVARGEQAIDPEVGRLIEAKDHVPCLTERQEQVLKAVFDGYTTDVIASQQGISTSAVKKHIARILTKLGATTRAVAVGIALKRHLLKA